MRFRNYGRPTSTAEIERERANDVRVIDDLLARLELLEGGAVTSAIQHAIDVIFSTYGDVVSVDEKKKDLLKFGRNPNVGSSGRFTIWNTGQDEANETYVADNVNSIDTISSSDSGDTEVVRVEGHTMTGGNRTFSVQFPTLNGQNKVTLATPLNRISRIGHNQASAVDLVGEVYAYEDTPISSGKPSDTTKIHITVSAGENQSEKASTTLSSTDYWILSGFSAGYPQKAGSNVADVRIEVADVGGVFLPKSKPLVVSTGTEAHEDFMPYLIVPKNCDLRITANASASSQDINADIQGYLATIIG